MHRTPPLHHITSPARRWLPLLVHGWAGSKSIFPARLGRQCHTGYAMGLPCAGQAQKCLVRRTRWGGVSRHADRSLDPQGRPTAHRYQHARRHRSCTVQAALSILQAAVRLKEVCPSCRNLLEHAHGSTSGALLPPRYECIRVAAPCTTCPCTTGCAACSRAFTVSYCCMRVRPVGPWCCGSAGAPLSALDNSYTALRETLQVTHHSTAGRTTAKAARLSKTRATLAPTRLKPRTRPA